MKHIMYIVWMFNPLFVFRPLYLIFQEEEESVRSYHDIERAFGLGDDESRSRELRQFTLHKN